MKKYIIPIILILFLAGILVYKNGINLGGDGFDAFTCNVTNVTAASVGDDISSTILSANSRRAFARIQQAPNEINAVFLSLDEGAAATVDNGLMLGTSTEAVTYLDFGLNTDNPYTGAITGITDTSTTTVLITDCIYNR